MDSFVSQLTGSVFHFRIYLPPCYDTMPHRYPYLLMLHGLGTGMDDSQWDRMGIAQAADGGYLEGTLPPMAIVMPNGNDADHASYRGPSPYPDLIVEELMPYLETTYCLSGNPDLHAVGGLSRGGFWAYYVALTSPELFGKVGGHSPYFYAPGSPYEKNPDSILDTAPGIEHLAMYLDHGPADYPEVIAGVRDYSNRLAARGIFPVLVINESGGHTEDYWSAHTGDYLSFYGADWPLQPSGLQECAVDSP